MKRILLLFRTTTYRAEAFLAAAERIGVPITVGSEHEQALARFHREGHLQLDFDDHEGGARTVADFAREHPFDAILAADDDGVLVAARAAERLGLPGNPFRAVFAARNKHLFRSVLAAHGAVSPWFLLAHASDDPRLWARRVEYPCVLKPTFLSGSRGVIRASDPEAFHWAFLRIRNLLADPDLAARGGEWAREILIEEYLPGDEVAIEALLAGGSLRVLALFDKPDPLEGPFFEESIYVTPSRRSAAEQAEVIRVAAEAVRALGLITGPVHAELRVHDGTVAVIEIAPRSIGGLCSRVLRFGDGHVTLEELLLRQALGEDVSGLAREPGAAAVMMIPVPRGGFLRAVNGMDEARAVPGIDDLRITIPAGDLVIPPPDGARYLGFIFARDRDPAGAENALREAHRALRFDIEASD